MESILTSVKKMLGIAEEDTWFDSDITFHINSVFSILTQLGVGPKEGFAIEDKTATWNDYISGDPAKLRLAKTYISLKVKLYFDPPINSSILSAIERQVQELEWRLNTEVDPGEKDNEQ